MARADCVVSGCVTARLHICLSVCVALPLSLSLSCACLYMLVSACCPIAKGKGEEFRTALSRAFDPSLRRLRSQHGDGASNDLQPGGQGLCAGFGASPAPEFTEFTGYDFRLSASRGHGEIRCSVERACRGLWKFYFSQSQIFADRGKWTTTGCAHWFGLSGLGLTVLISELPESCRLVTLLPAKQEVARPVPKPDLHTLFS